jgi:hypothetical protein
MKVMNAGVDRPLDHRQSRSINAPRCCRNLQSPVANRPLTARAIFFLISTSILRSSLRSSCPGDNGPFVAANETFVIAVLGRLQPAIELGEMPRQKSADCERGLAPVQPSLVPTRHQELPRGPSLPTPLCRVSRFAGQYSTLRATRLVAACVSRATSYHGGAREPTGSRFPRSRKGIKSRSIR